MRYTPAQWKPVELLLGGWRADVKAKLEAIADEYERIPDKSEDAARHRKRREVAGEVAAAARALLDVMEKHGADYEIGGDSLSIVLEGIAEAEEDKAEEARRAAPANREDRRRAWLLDRLITVWCVDLGRRDRPAVDRATGAVVEAGLVAFLVAASRPILPPDYPLSPEQARHAVRAWTYPPSPPPTLVPDDGTDPFVEALAAQHGE